MPEIELVVTGERVVTPKGVGPAAILVRGGRIEDVVSPPGELPGPGVPRVDAGDAVVMPGVVDVHVHLNEPGRTEWEGFESAGRAAAAGGVTCLVDMPLNSSPVTTNVVALEAKRAAARGVCAVDHAFWGGLVPGSGEDLASLLEAGVPGVKAFLVDSGIEEFPPVGEEELRPAMRTLAAYGKPLLVHAELPGPIEAATRAVRGAASVRAAPADGGGPSGGEGPGAPTPLDRGSVPDPRKYDTYLATRPPEAEPRAVAILLDLSMETGCQVHVVHVSTFQTLDVISAAKAEGVAVTCETCPHYLTFSAEEVPDGATEFKCAPPIRESWNREGLWRFVDSGAVDLIASDHSPAPPELRARETGDFLAAWGGIASLQLLLPAVWTEARRRGHGLPKLVRWLCEGSARLAGLEGRKGRIAPGRDADLVIWEPESSFRVAAGELYHRHALTPYLGRTLAGRVRSTYVRGVPVYADGRPTGLRPGREATA
ncbi:MAG: amidohydrolase family protein [Gemmatimonadota bacterium]